jgi:hypothetical protein
MVPPLHPLLETVFLALEIAGFRWALLRVPENLAIPDGDIDLLVDRADLRRASSILQSLGFAPVPDHGYGFHFLRYHKDTGCWLWLHVVTELSFGPYYALKTGAGAGCLARRQRLGALVTLAPDDAFWALLLHCIIDKGTIAPRHQRHLQALVGKVQLTGPLACFIDQVLPPDWSVSHLLTGLRCGNWPALERLRPSLSARWRLKQGITDRHLRTLGLLRAKHQARTLLRRRGLSVALIGPDGAGKTTLAEAIQRDFILPVRIIYGGLTGGRLPQVDALRVPVLVVGGRFGVFWCRYLLALYHQLHGRLVVFDRYIYDAVAPTPYRLSRLQRVYRWLDGHACPPPDLVLLLDAPGEVMHRRKGEYSPPELEDWRQHFLTLRRRLRRLEVVPTTRDQDLVRRDVINRIWRYHAARWSAGNS